MWRRPSDTAWGLSAGFSGLKRCRPGENLRLLAASESSYIARQLGSPFFILFVAVAGSNASESKSLANPFQHVFVVLVLFIAQSFEQLGIAPDATTIFRRAGSSPFEAKRVFRLGIKRRAAFEQHLVLPAIAEVVHVAEGKAFSVFGQKVAEQRPGRINVLESFAQQFGIAAVLALDVEQMKMAVGPAHCRLDVFVELVERAIC